MTRFQRLLLASIACFSLVTALIVAVWAGMPWQESFENREYDCEVIPCKVSSKGPFEIWTPDAPLPLPDYSRYPAQYVPPTAPADCNPDGD